LENNIYQKTHFGVKKLEGRLFGFEKADDMPKDRAGSIRCRVKSNLFSDLDIFNIGQFNFSRSGDQTDDGSSYAIDSGYYCDNEY
jgi:hypothetical protein